MKSTGSFTISSRLAAPAPVVWARVTTIAGVNAKLRPIVRLTVPRGRTDLHLDLARDGERLGRTWLLHDASCTVTDHVEFEPRLPGSRWLASRVFHATFVHRHRRLVAAFGPAPGL